MCHCRWALPCWLPKLKEYIRSVGTVIATAAKVPTDWVDADPDAAFHFVTGGVEAAVAKARDLAGDRDVTVSAGTIARQCLEAGLLDEGCGGAGAGGDGEGPPVLRGDVDRGRPAGRSDVLRSGR